MATVTKSVPVEGKEIKVVTFSDNEISPEVITSLLCRGATHARMSLLADNTKVLGREVRNKLVKDVFKRRG